jgi:hypothetical protein
MSEKTVTCPKCGHISGDDWSQCDKQCPMPGSPHHVKEHPLASLARDRLIEAGLWARPLPAKPTGE